MKKKIDGGREFIFSEFYPFKRRSKSTKKYSCLLGIGSNIGRSEQILKKLFLYLKKSSFADIINSSPIYKNPPFGYTSQPDFYNATIKIKTSLPPKQLMKQLLHTEKIFGRKRNFKNSPRTLDIDIIFFENIILYNNYIQIPHPKWQERESVIVPMAHM